MVSERKLLIRGAFITGFIILAVILTVMLVQVLGGEQGTSARQETQLTETGTLDGSGNTESINGLTGSETGTGETLALIEKPAVTSSQVSPDKQADVVFIQEVFPLISEWNLEAVQPYFSDATFSASEQYEGYQDVLNVLSERLGDLYNFDDPERVYENPGFVASADEVKLKEYAFKAYYALGTADVSMTLAGQVGPPSLYAFQFDVN